jgi:Cu/Ag efflux protein CusF
MPRSPLRGVCAVAIAMGLLLVTVGRGFGDQFHGTGTVLGVNPEAGMVFLDHDEIAGLMPPMKMGFRVASPELLKELKRGDRVQFTLTTGGELVITEIMKTEE